MTIELVRERLTNLFEFFKAVEERRMPKDVDVTKHDWVMWLDSLPVHNKLKILKPSPENGEWLVIQKPTLTICPPFPEVLSDWLEKGWDDPSFELAPKVKERTIQRGNDYVAVEFDSSQDRNQAYEVWSQKRALWRSVELPSRSVEKIWSRLFSLHEHIKRDGGSVELMLGDGIVSYKGKLEPIFHPLVLRKVELLFDPAISEFKLIDTESKPELYSSIFSSEEFGGVPLKKWQASLESTDFHPLDGEEFDYWLKGISGSLADGDFVKTIPETNSQRFRIGRSPVLFLRIRPTGRKDFIQKILDDIPKANSFPTSLISIVGLSPQETAKEEEIQIDGYANEHEDVLLTKPANTEQVEILRKLSKKDSVLVQGPPGTGKTHTIANLIGNFLAEGKSVLVTSHTTKALRVVRDQVAKPLQSLCVSYLDSDTKSRSEREIAIRELASRLSDNPEQYREEAKKLTERRTEILLSLKKTRSDLLLVVGGEYTPIVLDGKEIEPSTAAKEVAEGDDLHSWIPGPITNSEPIPLSDAQVSQIYEIGQRLSVLDEAELSEKLPTLTLLPSEELFKEKVEEFNDLSRSKLEFRKDLWTLPKADLISLGEICISVTEQVRYLQEMRKEPWKLAVIQAGIEGGANKEVWNLLCNDIKDVKKQAEVAAKYIYAHAPKLSEKSNIDVQLKELEKIEKKFQAKGSISYFSKLPFVGWGTEINEWRVGDKAPTTVDDFIALRILAEITLSREKLKSRWERQMSVIGVASLSGNDLQPEDYAFQFINQIQVLLSWHSSIWLPLENSLVSQGLDWKTVLAESPQSTSVYHVADRLSFAVEKLLPPVLEAEDRRRRFAILEIEFAKKVSYLSEVQASRKNSSLVTAGLINALNNRSTISYQKEIVKLIGLTSLISDYLLRNSLLDRLLPFAKNWVEILRTRQEHITPETTKMEAAIAWRWLQLSQELKRRAAMSLEEIQERVRRQTDELEKVTIGVVEKLSWAGLLAKVTNEQRQALLGWSAYIKKIGARTGKLVPILEREAQVEMENARGAVPVWIMPFSEITRSFHPIRDKFDVIIIDESSQEDVLGLVPLYMAKKVIVVGDDEQVTPLAVGEDTQPIQQLINQWLVDLPASKLFDLKVSVYDRAQIAFGSVIRLKEHFRCVPEIIQFSNSLCYNYTIKPLRESTSTIVKPALVPHRVQGNYDGKTNKSEAQTIVDLICACIETPEYEGKSIGVITMVGDKQSDLIGTMLRARLSPLVYDQRRILCGNPAQFQGDERDIIFLSMVDSKDDGLGPLSLRQDGSDNMYKKRFNVASSRAKDQLWVVYSLDPQTQLKPNDIRRRLIEHAIDPSNLMNQLNAGLTKTESPFEAEVYKILCSLGYRVTPQWQVGAYRIDMVAEGNGKRLAIECDGERWHYDKAEEDLARQALLERLGWTFVRIRGSVFYRDKTPGRQVALLPLIHRLKEIGIEPNYETNLPEIDTKQTLADTVKQKAAEIRAKGSALADETSLIESEDEVNDSSSIPPQVVKNSEDPLTVTSATQSKLSVQHAQQPLFDINKANLTKNSEQIHSLKPHSFREGDRVIHPKLGLGTVIAVKKYGDQISELEIGFDTSSGIKTLTASSIRLASEN